MTNGKKSFAHLLILMGIGSAGEHAWSRRLFFPDGAVANDHFAMIGAGTRFADHDPMGTWLNRALMVRIDQHHRRQATGVITRAIAWVRDALRTRIPPRNPVFRLEPRRMATRSMCGGWFVITPLPKSGKEIFQARHAIGMGRLTRNRRID